ncbi:hypothetical protein KAR91_59075 [Candidatus Pacearchaeota archaeon]|nr:hypothetical protein [Candidatus Pacearchaeota archaeon]
MNLTTESLSQENIKLLKILDLVCQLNKATKDDWFFDFAGNVKTVLVHYSKTVKKKCEHCCTEKEVESTYLTSMLGVKQQSSELNDLIKELETHLKNAKN